MKFQTIIFIFKINSVIDDWGIACKLPSDEMNVTAPCRTLAQLMARCRQVGSHNLRRYCPRSVSSYHMASQGHHNYSMHILMKSWWRHQMESFPRYWPFVRGIHRSTVNSPHKGQWRGALIFSLIFAWIDVWVNNRETGDLRRHRAHYDVTVMN